MPSLNGIPSVNVEALISAQRKSIESLTSASQTAFEAFQSLSRRQAELARQNFEATTGVVQSILSAPTPEEKLAKQTEAAKATLDRSVSNLKEITDTITKNQYQTIELVSHAFTQSLEDFKNIVKPSQAA